ncbi:MAG: PHP domain-containing protein [Candidatus Theseobacter exili]|nr:PHP domain-containing protein [Candidatus Theseobacter exili]
MNYCKNKGVSEVDLHIHTNVSDGTFSPSDIVAEAANEKLRAIAITDHDSVDGNQEAIDAGLESGVEVIPGIEISAEFGPGTLHILGYYIDYNYNPLLEKMKFLDLARKRRNPRIIEQLQIMGADISYEELLEEAGVGVAGRPHIAQILVRKGFIRTEQEAFDKYLAKGKPAYVDKERLSIESSFDLICSSGGIPVLAHPVLMKVDHDRLRRLVHDWVNIGLQGIEVYSPCQSPAEQAFYLDVAGKEDLIVTGGTDFHGKNKPDIRLGIGRGNLSLSYEMVNELKAKKGSITS